MLEQQSSINDSRNSMYPSRTYSNNNGRFEDNWQSDPVNNSLCFYHRHYRRLCIYGDNSFDSIVGSSSCCNKRGLNNDNRWNRSRRRRKNKHGRPRWIFHSLATATTACSILIALNPSISVVTAIGPVSSFVSSFVSPIVVPSSTSTRRSEENILRRWYCNNRVEIPLLRNWNGHQRRRRGGISLMDRFPQGHEEPRSSGGDRPLPAMPSQTFFDLANSQLELLSNSLWHSSPPNNNNNNEASTKIKSIALYLPQENPTTGQLEFLPSVVYPHPNTSRIFIASDSDSGLPPSEPASPLTHLPGFAQAQTLIPTYPFMSSAAGDRNDSGVGAVGIGEAEEVMCDIKDGGAALSLSLFWGSRTIGVLLVWPAPRPLHRSSVIGGDGGQEEAAETETWSENDRRLIKRAAETLALALSMDSARFHTEIRTEQFRVALEDSLHQVKNPIQAMRTYSKLLQRTIGETDGGSGGGVDSVGVGDKMPTLSALAANIMEQGDRVASLLLPMDSIVNTLDGYDSGQGRPLLLAPREERDLILHPKSTDRTNAKPTTALSSTSNVSVSPSTADLNIEMAFVPDVLEPILLTSRTMAYEHGIDFDVVYGLTSDSSSTSTDDNQDMELPGVLLCPQSLREAVLNGLDNAIKYVTYGFDGQWGVVNANPKIRVRLVPNDQWHDIEPTSATDGDGLLPLPEPGVTIYIEDNGPGIRKEEREDVFRRGYRSDAARVASREGSGIGLDIGRGLVHRMGGTLDFVDNGGGEVHLGGAVMRIVLFRDPRLQGFNRMDTCF